MNKSIRNLTFTIALSAFFAIPMFANTGGGAPRPPFATVLSNTGGGAPRPPFATVLDNTGGGAPRPPFAISLN